MTGTGPDAFDMEPMELLELDLTGLDTFEPFTVEPFNMPGDDAPTLTTPRI